MGDSRDAELGTPKPASMYEKCIVVHVTKNALIGC